jgi:hypothetical protein
MSANMSDLGLAQPLSGQRLGEELGQKWRNKLSIDLDFVLLRVLE